MSLRWAESGGQYHSSSANNTLGGLFGTGITGQSGSSVAVSRNGSLWSYGQNVTIVTPNLGGSSGFSGGIMGYALYTGTSLPGNNTFYLGFLDNNNAEQCSLRINGSGQFFFSRNGTNLGAGNPTVSANALSTATWYYVEFKCALATGSTGTCEVVVNGVTWLTLNSIQNATTTAKWWAAKFVTPNTGGQSMMDLYCLDTDGGANTTYLGDVTVAEIYDNAAGVNSAWSVNQASFSLTGTGTLTSGVSLVYNGTITNGASPANAWQGYYFTVTGFANSHNNGTFLCSASTATTITLLNTDTSATGSVSGATATAAFQNPLQNGIHGGVVDGYKTTNTGVAKPGVIGTSENQYITSNTTNQKTDYGHQTLSLTGAILGVIHRTYARKDDAGARSIAQICESTGTEEIGSTIALSSTYSYYDDVLETDPHTGNQWSLSGFNAATFGVKEIT